MSQTYIRTQHRRVPDIGRTIVLAVRKATDVAEVFGEHDVYTGWASFLCAQGSTHGASVKQAADLLEAGTLLTRQKPPLGAGVNLGSESEENCVPSAPSTPTFDLLEEGVTVPLGIFTVSIHPRTGLRRSHQVGNCPLVPRADYALYAVCWILRLVTAPSTLHANIASAMGICASRGRGK